MPKKTVNKNYNYSKDFDLVSEFLGYRDKEDQTNLAPGYLVRGSRNIRNTTGGRISIREGYVLDGQIDATLSGITASYDWLMHNNNERNLRAGNGLLQVRYIATAGDKYLTNTFTEGQIYWIPIMSSLSTATNFNFAEFWDTTELKDRLLMVNGSSNVYKWSGGITTIKAVTSNSIEKNGSTSWAEEGFNTAGTRELLINGTTYTYTGGESTTTLTGVTANPSGETVNSVVIQKPITTANSAITGLLSSLSNDLISVLNNQVYIASNLNRSVYVSAVNSIATFAFTTPTRLVGEGGLLTLDSCPVGFVPQEDAMYITAGKNDWYVTQFTKSADLTAESLQVKKLKTGSLQAAKSQAFISKMKNSVVFVSNEPTLDELGRVEQILGTPQQTNISDPIKNLFDSYDFTDGQVFYHKYFVYVSVPKENVVLMYNLAKGFWEAPQTIPIARFSIIDGELYGHDYNVPQTYKLFTGYNDNGHAINAIAKFSFQNYGQRAKSKYFNEYYFEGYIDKNTTLTAGIQYETDGCATSTTYDITGDDSQIVCLPTVNSSLGKESFGKNPLGGDLTQHNVNDLPPKFRCVKTFPRKDFYEVQYSFSSIGIDYRWELLAFGSKAESSMYGNTSIMQ
jgi:hypothetical protein